MASEALVMGPGTVDLKAVRVLDTRMNIDQQRVLGVYQGPKQVSFYRDISQSYNNSIVNHTIQPPWPVLVSREVYLQWYLEFTFTGADQGGPLVELGTNDGIRAFPCNQAMSSASVTINGAKTSTNSYDILNALAHYQWEDDLKKDLSGTGSMLDSYMAYSDYVALGSARNPLAFFGENSSQPSRGSLRYTVVSNTNTAATIRVVIREPLMISPFSFGSKQQPALTGINIMNFQFNLINDLTYLWSHSSSGKTFATIAASFYQPPELLLNYLSPGEGKAQFDPDKTYTYPYITTIPYLTSVGNVTAGSSSSVTSGNISTFCIPDRVFLWLRRRNADRTYLTTDTFARIDTISINWQNESNLLSNANSFQLYQMSVENGLQDAFPQWDQYSGSVCCVRFGRDVGLSDREAVSLSGKYQFTVTVNFTNPSAGTINYDLIVVPVLSGALSIAGSSAFFNVGIISEKDIQKSLQYPSQNETALWKTEMWGGSFFSDLRDTLGGLWKGAKSVAGVAAPVVDALLGSAISSGRGIRKPKKAQARGGTLMGGCMDCGGACDGKCGEVMSHRSLMSRLRG